MRDVRDHGPVTRHESRRDLSSARQRLDLDVSPQAKFSMYTRRFYTPQQLGRDVAAAGLKIRAREERPVLPGGSLVVAGWVLERNG